jgi:hypothetical protein
MGIQINGQTDTISASDGSLSVSGVDLTNISNLNATGIITAISFVGDGSNLTGVAATTSLTIGRRSTAYQINAVGTAITVSLRSGIGTLNF